MTTRLRRPAQYKQMALETAIRNPERYFTILPALLDFEGVVLNDANLLDIMVSLYKKELVGSGDVDLTLSDDEIKSKIVEVNSTRNADGGFPRGYAARFWTYMRTPSEFGFIYAQYNQPLQISSIVKQVDSGNLAEQEAFAVQALKGNRMSPYRNVSNDFNFYNFIFQLLKRRQASGHVLSMEQFILATFSRDGNVDACVEELKSTSFNGTESVFSYLQSHYGITNRIGTVTQDYPDVVIRVLVIMGMVSIKYTGVKLLGLNQNKIDFFDKLLSATPTLNDEAKTDAKLFFDELNRDVPALTQIVQTSRQTDIIKGSEYTSKLLSLAEQYSLDHTAVVNELTALSTTSKTTLFKEMAAPLRLEFYIAMLIALVYGDKLEIRPNYKADHEGKPYSHAPGGGGDIDVFSENLYWLIEVTLIRNRQQQQNSETTTVFRHMTSNTEFSEKEEKYLSFVAPVVHDDTQAYFEYATITNRSAGINFGSYSIQQFIAVTEDRYNLMDMERQTAAITDAYRKKLS